MSFSDVGCSVGINVALIERAGLSQLNRNSVFRGNLRRISSIISDVYRDVGSREKGRLEMIRHSDRILLVDDDIFSLEVLREVLIRAGYEAVSAESGYEALEIVRAESINLAILDFNLPDTTGSELLQQIKQFQPSMPVIIMSANTSQSVKFDVFEAGAYTFIPKPMDLPQLLRFVARALNLKRQWTPGRGGRREVVSAANTHTIQIKKSIFFRWIRIIKHK